MIYPTRIAVSAALVLASVNALGGTLLDEIAPHIEERIELGVGDQILAATVLSVGVDHFCVRVHIPNYEHRRCYAASAISFVSDGGGARPFGISVFEPK